MAEVKDVFKKSSAASLEARESGNRLYTQTNHDGNKHKEILLWYSKSIAFAVENDELALGYSNRSELLLHLKKYDECLLDIDRALKLTKSTGLKSELESRQATCVDAMRSPSDNINNDNKAFKNVNVKKKRLTRKEKKSLEQKVEVTLKLPYFTPSAKISSASEAVTVKYNEQFGRHMIATRYIRPGEVIVTERGYVCFPTLTKRHLVCSHCLSFAWNGIPCDHCAFVVYCSEDCKADAWNEYHDVECALFLTATRPLFYREDFLPFLMVAPRLLIKAIKCEGLDAVIREFSNANSGNRNGVDGVMVKGKLRSDSFRSCINLHGHPDNKKFDDSVDSVISDIIEVLHCRTSLFNSKESEMTEETISQLEIMVKKLTYIIDDNVFEYQVFDCDCELITDCRNKCDAKRGIVLAPISSLINHSCNHNVDRMFLPKGKIAMFTVAPVKKGEQIFISYGTTFPIDKTSRQLHLQDFFDFTCKCQACEENWTIDSNQITEHDYNEAMKKIGADLAKCFPFAVNNSVMTASVEDSVYDEEALKIIAKLSELTYKHFDNIKLAWCYNITYNNYIMKAFHALYGEKFAIPGCTASIRSSIVDRCQSSRIISLLFPISIFFLAIIFLPILSYPLEALQNWFTNA